MKPKMGNNSETSRSEAYEIYLYVQKGDHVKCGGCIDQALCANQTLLVKKSYRNF
jgi:hypothetical protein